jgi:hypothetical protein
MPLHVLIGWLAAPNNLRTWETRSGRWCGTVRLGILARMSGVNFSVDYILSGTNCGPLYTVQNYPACTTILGCDPIPCKTCLYEYTVSRPRTVLKVKVLIEA